MSTLPYLPHTNMTYPACKNERSLSNRHSLPLASTICSPISKGSGSTPGTKRNFRSRHNTMTVLQQLSGQPHCICTASCRQADPHNANTLSSSQKHFDFIVSVRVDASMRKQAESRSKKLRLHAAPLLYSSLLMNCHMLELVTNSQLVLIRVQHCLLLAASKQYTAKQ